MTELLSKEPSVKEGLLISCLTGDIRKGLSFSVDRKFVPGKQRMDQEVIVSVNLTGMTVSHKKFGKGIVRQLEDNSIAVVFGKTEKKFQFPEAFGGHLTAEDRKVQKNLERLNEVYCMGRERQKEREQKAHAHRSRLYAMKIRRKSQAAYRCTEETPEEIWRRRYIETGCYVSGPRKGEPRVPSMLQPNSAILLTAATEQESERKILGVAMADESFWGEECSDGRIRLHERYFLILPEKKELPFWENFESGTVPAAWGSAPCKYFQISGMQRILQEICRGAEGTEKEKETKRFYHYFCVRNRLA